MLALVRIWPSGFDATMQVIPKRQNTECLGSSSIAKPFATHSEAADINDSTRVAVAETNLINYHRAVAAATGRRSKSSCPDVAARIGKFGYI